MCTFRESVALSESVAFYSGQKEIFIGQEQLMKALQVSINGDVIGVFVPPEGSPFAAMLGNIPKHYMRAQIMSGTHAESWQWRLPDIAEGQTISFCMVDAEPGGGVPPQFKRPIAPAERSANRRRARTAYEKAMKERQSACETEAVSPFIQIAATKDRSLIDHRRCRS